HACGNSNYSDTAFTIAGTSAARCGAITGPIADNATSVAGTVTTAVAGTIVNLFVDGVSVGSQTISGTAWSIPVNTTVNNTIYAGAVLTISIAESNKTEVTCAATQTVSCTPPASPTLTPTNTTISAGQTVTYTVTSTTSGLLYSIRDNADASNVGESKFGNGSTVNITTDPFNTAGTYTIKIKATSFSGANCTTTSNATVVVTGVLPLSLTKFTGLYLNGIAKLSWQTDYEQGVQQYEVQRSIDGINFKMVGVVNAIGNSTATLIYSFEDVEITSKIIYQRLKIIESNGSFKYSKIVVFRADKGITTSTVSPNPFESNIKFDFETEYAQKILINMYDLMGKKVKGLTISAHKGINTVNIADMKLLPTGTYIIEMIAGGERIFKDILLKK
ncbi:MAG: T9SS type A sorting domain-containing protein, partial [Ferruginibacter sp.]|nr:T9SS type A sorting domain-containing protein [Ferruginibacter sp.]